MKLVNVITGLETGGAELVLLKLSTIFQRMQLRSEVISLTTEGRVGRMLRAQGIPVHTLGMRFDPRTTMVLPRLVSLLRSLSPDLVQTWLYHGCLLGGLGAKWSGGIPVVWGLRNSRLDATTTSWGTRTVANLCSMTSGWVPSAIVSCSETARIEHIATGYPSEKVIVIPNGFDVDALRPNQEARRRYRSELGIPEEALVVGLVGRYHPQKDHQTFLSAARLVAKRMPSAHFVLVGEGCSLGREPFASSFVGTPVERVHLLGRREDASLLNAAFDVACSSSSYGEGFPNVVGEAMACGVPCVVTNVGDSARVVGDTGRVVPPKQPDAFATAIIELLTLEPSERADLSVAARARIEQSYRIEDVAQRYVDLYKTLVQASGAPT